MPPKQASSGQLVYVVVATDYIDADESDQTGYQAKKVQLISSHASLEAANQKAKAQFQRIMKIQWTMLMPDELLDQYIAEQSSVVTAPDGTIEVRYDGEISYSEVKVVRLPFLGGSIVAGGTGKPATKKDSAKPATTSKHNTSASADTDEESVVQKSRSVTPAMVAKSAAKAGGKRKTLADVDEEEDDDDEADDQSSSVQLADVEGHVSLNPEHPIKHLSSCFFLASCQHTWFHSSCTY